MFGFLSGSFRSGDHRRAGEGAAEAPGWDHTGHHHGDAGEELQAHASRRGGKLLPAAVTAFDLRRLFWKSPVNHSSSSRADLQPQKWWPSASRSTASPGCHPWLITWDRTFSSSCTCPNTQTATRRTTLRYQHTDWATTGDPAALELLGTRL